MEDFQFLANYLFFYLLPKTTFSMPSEDQLIQVESKPRQMLLEISTQAHSKYVPYCTFRGSFKVKCPVSGAKTRVQYATLTRLCYVDIGTSCSGSEFKYLMSVTKS